MIIHSLCPFRKLALYWVTKELAQVLRTVISAWISWMSSSLDSRSIWTGLVSFLGRMQNKEVSRASFTYMLDGDNLAGHLIDSLVNNTEASTYFIGQ